jgi:type II secretory pathway pseudopilin PulG
MKARRSQLGFTLVELLVVIVIMIFLLGIVVGSITRLQTQHERGESLGRLHALARALQLYREDWGDVPPYDPANTPHGIGLYALVMLDYLSTPRFLNDAGSPVHSPWILTGGGNRLENIVPDDRDSLRDVLNAATGQSLTGPLTMAQEYQAYAALADPSCHEVQSGTLANLTTYDEDAFENFCSWMMRDPLTKEWKYQPIRATATFAVADANQPDYYHRQLSHRSTDEDTARYTPAAHTVVTWSHLFRARESRPAPAYNKAAWGVDLILYADGHAAVEPAPDNAGGTWGPPRALVRPTAP